MGIDMVIVCLIALGGGLLTHIIVSFMQASKELRLMKLEGMGKHQHSWVYDDVRHAYWCESCDMRTE